MGIKTVKRLAAGILHAGESRVRIDPAEQNKISEALTREDVRGYIKDGLIWAEKKTGVSRIRAKIRASQKKKGRRKGMGSRKGRASARSEVKRNWINKVRKQRGLLQKLVSGGEVGQKERRNIYLRIKGGAFKSKAAMISYLKENELMKEEKKEVAK